MDFPESFQAIPSRSCRFFGSLAGALLLALGVAGSAAGATIETALETRLAELAAPETLRFIVQLEPGPAPDLPASASRRASVRSRQQAVIDAVGTAEIEILHRYENLAGFTARGGAEAVKALAGHPGVLSIYADRKVYATLAQGVPLIGADYAAALGFAGAGVSVAVLDTGIDTDHPDLVDDIVAERCWCGDNCCPDGSDAMSGAGAAEDDNGHGTSVSGVVTAAGLASSSGVAPDAGIIAIKVLSDAGSGSFSDIDTALDWLITNHATYNLRAVNLSLGDGTEHSNPLVFPCSNSISASAIEDLVALGVAVVAASGNDGYDGGISLPACVPEAISVGGVYDANIGSISWCGGSGCDPALCTDSSTAPDQFVCHTNNSTDLDVLAPDWRTRTSARGGGARNFGGTSAATPYVAGLVALLTEQDPSRQPADLLALMTGNSPMVTNPDNGLSFPRADVSAAFSVCGDGNLDPGEECDDTNLLAGDCCSASCTFEPAGASCDDGDACTASDQCDGAGACDQSSPLICDNGLFCDGAETCDVALGCQPGSPPVVDDGVGCTADSCDEVGDVVVNAPDDGLCDNGAYCDGSETCDAALDCQSGSPPVVDDGVGCTADSCDEVGDVVVNAPDDGLCDNGAYCDGSETCDAALDCQVGVPPVVDDGVGCTADSCDEVGDVVVNAPDDGLCDNGAYCDGSETCDAALDCQVGSPPVVDDGVGCTADSCDEVGDVVVNAPDDGLCDNGAYCDGSETCDAALDCQVGSPPVVDDGVGCTADSCDEVGDVVVNAPDDGLCDNGAYCDGAETCDAALDCQVGSPPVVDDGVGCTADSCDEVGDVVVNAPDDGLCDNGAYCDGSETCDAALDCQVGVPPVVDDGVGCTADSCDEVGDVVVNAADDGLCDNGAYCDGSETCDAALDCQVGSPPVVDDGVGCTADSCDEVGDVVVNAPDAWACDDGDPCTAEVCDQLTGCANILIEGCGVAVPAAGTPGTLALMLGLLVMGWASLLPGRRRRP